MLELDKRGNWWLEGSIIEPWEITEKWTHMVNVCEVMADTIERVNATNQDFDTQLAAQADLLKRCLEVVSNYTNVYLQRSDMSLLYTCKKAQALLPDLRKAVGEEVKI
jgi:hypothetical protein